MEANNIIGKNIKIQKDVKGNEDIDIVRRLRNAFSHGMGRYKHTEKEHKKLFEQIVLHYRLNPNGYPEKDEKFPIPIDKVLKPMARACLRYAEAVAKIKLLK